MARVLGPSLAELDARGDELAARVSRAIRTTLRDVASTTTDVEDLNRIRTVWRSVVVNALVPRLRVAWDASVEDIRAQLNGLNLRNDIALVAAVFEIPKVRNTRAELFLEGAQNRLVGIGDIVWETARGELLLGLKSGEGIIEIRERVIASAEVSERRATTIARTEVNGAMNAGSFAQMKALGLPAIKEWIATDDERTRHTHREIDGEEVDGDESFIVGGWPMDYPLDPKGPPEETISCRCTLAWEIVDDEVDYDAALVADVFHLPGRHEQKKHGNRSGHRAKSSRTVKSTSTAAKPTKSKSLNEILDSPEITKLLDNPESFDYSSKKTEDTILAEIVKQRGFDAQPELVDALPSDVTPMARAVSEERFAQQFLTGDYFAGKGQFGNGTYFISTSDPSRLSGVVGIYGDHRVNAALKSNARIASLDDIQKEMTPLVEQAERDEQELFGRALEYFQRGDAAGFERDYGRARRRVELLRDPGRVAALLEYDAINVTPDQSESEIVVLNRGAVQAERSVQ